MSAISLIARAGSAAPDFVYKTLNAGQPPKLFTLAMVKQENRVLLGKKKRGFGAGYYNGFGGKVEPQETILEAASRELVEEAGIHADVVEHKGVLTFVFDNEPRPWEVHVFNVPSFSGTPVETDEMQPVWFDFADIPYSNMWADDVHWYPLYLADNQFQGTFAFTNTTQLVWHHLEEGVLLEQNALSPSA